jgi:hypothetical protein
MHQFIQAEGIIRSQNVFVYFKKFCGTANLPPSQAFNSSNMCARIGIHNDCFMASSQDQGTFESNAQRTWLTNEGRYVIVGGESCESNSLTGCTGGVNQINKQRFSYLNVEYHPTVIKAFFLNDEHLH